MMHGKLNIKSKFLVVVYIREWYQPRRFESIAKTDHYDLLSGNWWKERLGLADTATEFPL